MTYFKLSSNSCGNEIYIPVPCIKRHTFTKKLLSNKNISNEFKTYVILLLLLIDLLFAINNEEIVEDKMTFDMGEGEGGGGWSRYILH